MVKTHHCVVGCIINIVSFLIFLKVIWNKTVLLGLCRFLNLNVLHKGLLLQDSTGYLDWTTTTNPLWRVDFCKGVLAAAIVVISKKRP